MTGEDAARLESIERQMLDLRRDLIETRALATEAQQALSATTAFYEQRVDQIERRVTSALRAYLGRGALESPGDIEADAVVSRLFGMRPGSSATVSIDDLQAALAPHLRPGPILGALTVWGFKLERRAARELGDAILLTGAAPGIAVYGPYKTLAKGVYRLSLRLAPAEKDRDRQDAERVSFDVYGPDIDAVAAVGDGATPSPAFEWAGGKIEFRVQNNSGRTWLLSGFDLDAVER